MTSVIHCLGSSADSVTALDSVFLFLLYFPSVLILPPTVRLRIEDSEDSSEFAS
jgi:hypothetical protein